VQAALPVAGDIDVVTLVGEQRGEDGAELRFVLDEEQSKAACGGWWDRVHSGHLRPRRDPGTANSGIVGFTGFSKAALKFQVHAEGHEPLPN
jgi:hypothetical protein